MLRLLSQWSDGSNVLILCAMRNEITRKILCFYSISMVKISYLIRRDIFSSLFSVNFDILVIITKIIAIRINRQYRAIFFCITSKMECETKLKWLQAENHCSLKVTEWKMKIIRVTNTCGSLSKWNLFFDKSHGIFLVIINVFIFFIRFE